MRVGIIGAGKVGTTIGKYLSEHGIFVTGYFSRTAEHAKKAADFSGTKVFYELEALTEASDTLFIATPDGEIGKVWDCIAGLELKEKVICHFSGSLSSGVFSGIDATGAYGASLHPMYAFCGESISYLQFHTALFVAEGHEKALKILEMLFAEQLGHRIFKIKQEDKIKYHAAATLVSNDMIALFGMGVSLLSQCGFSAQESMQIFTPLVKNNVDAMLQLGPEGALTGPVERNDVETVRKHLKVTGEEAKISQAYAALGAELVGLARRKHPERDYTVLESIFDSVIETRPETAGIRKGSV